MAALSWLLVAAQISFPAKPVKKDPPKAEIVSLDKVWDRSPHNAFTDPKSFPPTAIPAKTRTTAASSNIATKLIFVIPFVSMIAHPLATNFAVP